MSFSWVTFKKPIIIAHRGAPALGRENSIAGFYAALAAGAEAIETDIRQTQDGHFVCFHDADLMRLTGSNERIDELSFANLKEKYPHSMTLSQAIEARGEAGLLLDIKMKSPEIAASLHKEIQLLRDKSFLLLGIRNIQLAARLRILLPEIPILGFIESPSDINEWANLGAQWIRLWEADFTVKHIATTKALGLKIAVMTGDWRPPENRTSILRDVGIIDQKTLLEISYYDPDAILLDDPRLMSVKRSHMSS